MAEINNPHDHFVKATLSQPDIAASFLTNYLPRETVDLLDTSKVELVKDSFVDSDLREHQSDMLFQVQTRNGKAAYVYVLLEHKSAPDQWVAFQLFRYMVRIWESAIRQEHVKPLPVIIPLVLYHGQAAWNVSTQFSALFPSDMEAGLQRYLPELEYLLCNLSEYNDEQIIGEAKLRVALLILKYIKSAGLGPRLPEIFKLYPRPGQTAGEYFWMILRYLSVASDKLTNEELTQAIKTGFPQQEGGLMPTLAEQWIKEGMEKGLQQGLEKGREEGREEGLQQGAASLTLRLLQRRIGTVDSQTKEQIESLSIERLQQLGEALLDFHALSDLTTWLSENDGRAN